MWKLIEYISGRFLSLLLGDRHCDCCDWQKLHTFTEFDLCFFVFILFHIDSGRDSRSQFTPRHLCLFYVFFFYYCYTPEQIRCRQNELFTLLNYSLTYCKPKWIIISMGTCYSGFSGNWQNKLQMREEKIEFVELFCCSLHGHQSSNFAMWSDCRMLGANDNWVNHRWSVG